MNEHTPMTFKNGNGISAEQISRRAYELWEEEGRPEGRDLHHWLRAEQDLRSQQGTSGPPAAGSAASAPSRGGPTDTEPLRGTRAAAAAARDAKSAPKPAVAAKPATTPAKSAGVRAPSRAAGK